MGMGGYAVVQSAEAALIAHPDGHRGTERVAWGSPTACALLVTLAATAAEEASRYFGSKARLTRFAGSDAYSSTFREREHRPPFTILIFGGSQNRSH